MAEKHIFDTGELLNKYKKLILNSSLILLALIISFRIYAFGQKKIAEFKKQKDLEVKKNEVLGGIAQSEERLKDYKDFLNRKDLSAAIKTLGAIARDSSVKIVSLRPGGKKDYPEYIAYPFDLTVQAQNYHLLGEFIAKLESHSDIYIVESAVLRPQSSGQQTNLAMNLKLLTVLYKD